jgi:LmbE family N-acetylglucosaminyl deacetylase
MATLVVFHAHPDDEATTTGGTIARASDEGHRVVLVIATNGDYGEADGVPEGESLVEHRRREAEASGAVLGVARIVWLGYRDSGLTGWEQNTAPESFLQAPLEEAAERLAAVLREEHADVLTVYDWHGNYGHPDHVKVHTVGHRAAELAGTPAVYEATMNRDDFTRWLEEMKAAGEDVSDFENDEEGPSDDGNPLGLPESELALAVDIRPWLARKRAAFECYASQITDTGFFLSMSEERFGRFFGTEWFALAGAEGLRTGWFFE